MKQALLVIDYINGIAKTGTCADYLSTHPEIIANTNALIAKARAKQIPVIHVRLAFENEKYEGFPLYSPHIQTIKEHKKFLLGHSDTEFIEEIDIKEQDFIVNKKYGDPFYGSYLEELLKKENIKELIFTGVSTSNAILNGTNSAMLKGYSVMVAVDACAAPNAELHTQALAMMKPAVTQFLTTREIFV